MVHRSASVQQDPHKMFESQRAAPTGDKTSRAPRAPKPQRLPKAPRQGGGIDLSRYKPDWGVFTPTWKKAGAVLLAYTALTWDRTPIPEAMPPFPLIDPASPPEVISDIFGWLAGSPDSESTTPSATTILSPAPTTLAEAQPQTVPTVPVVGEVAPTTIGVAGTASAPTTTLAFSPETTTAQPNGQAFISGRIVCPSEVMVDFQPTDNYAFNAIERTEGRESNMAHIADPDATNLWNEWVAQRLDGRAPEHGETFPAPAGCIIPPDLILPD